MEVLPSPKNARSELKLSRRSITQLIIERSPNKISSKATTAAPDAAITAGAVKHSSGYPKFHKQNWISTMRHTIIALIAVIFIALPHSAYADLTGQVIHVADGNNLTVVINNEWIRVRLAGIDAPEKNQPFGTRSRQSLSELCFWKQVTVVPKGKDQYGRMFAKVRCGEIDAGEEQVKRGMAWVYDRYVKDPSLDPIQDEARTAERGLWADPYSTPPWEWREMWD